MDRSMRKWTAKIENLWPHAGELRVAHRQPRLTPGRDGEYRN